MPTEKDFDPARCAILLNQIKAMEEDDKLFAGGLQGAALEEMDGMPLLLSDEGEDCVSKLLSLLDLTYEDFGSPWEEGRVRPEGIEQLMEEATKRIAKG